ncbi:MAG: hypothetical protein HPY75_03250 [Actinobacteria bacterium]|nr:hypothetical protein [Actinomycetota bacterium]
MAVIPSLLFAIAERGDIKTFVAKPALDLINHDYKYQAVKGESEPLWGTDAIYEATDHVYLAEGIFDALTLRQAGLAAMSLQGTDNAKRAARLLAEINKRFSMPSIEVLLDGDSAGEKATEVFILTAISMGLTGRVVRLDWEQHSGETHYEDINELFVGTGCSPEELKRIVVDSARISDEEFLLDILRDKRRSLKNLLAEYMPSKGEAAAKWRHACKKARGINQKEFEEEIRQAEQICNLREPVVKSTEVGSDFYDHELSTCDFLPYIADAPESCPALGVFMSSDRQGEVQRFYSFPIMGERILGEGNEKVKACKLLIVTSDRSCMYYETPQALYERLGILFPADVPQWLRNQPWDNRWSREHMKDFMRGADWSPKEVYEKLCDKIRELLDLGSIATESIVALWIMATYFFDIFDAFPYLYVSGEMGSGKTRLLELLAQVSFNGNMLSGTTVAEAARKIDIGRVTFILDEAEMLGGAKRGGEERYQDLRLILQAGYKAGSTIGRAVKDKDKWDGSTVEYNVYSPKAFACIVPPHRVLRSRCIEIAMLKTGNRDISKRPIDSEAEIWEEIRSGCYTIGLGYIKQAMELLADKENKLVYPDYLSNREQELWLPILLMANLIDPNGTEEGLYDEIVAEIKKRPPSSRVAEYIENIAIALQAYGAINKASVFRKTIPEVVEIVKDFFGGEEEQAEWRQGKDDNWRPTKIDEKKVSTFIRRFHIPQAEKVKGEYKYKFRVSELEHIVTVYIKGLTGVEGQDEKLGKMEKMVEASHLYDFVDDPDFCVLSKEKWSSTEEIARAMRLFWNTKAESNWYWDEEEFGPAPWGSINDKTLRTLGKMVSHIKDNLDIEAKRNWVEGKIVHGWQGIYVEPAILREWEESGRSENEADADSAKAGIDGLLREDENVIVALDA